MKKDSTNQNKKKIKSVPKSAEVDLSFASSIIDSTSDAVIAIKLNGEITLWNNGAVACYGYTSGEALGKNISMVYRKEDLPLLAERIKKVINGENISNAEVTIIDKSKNERSVLLSINGIKDEKGKVNQMVGITKDITEKKHIEAKLKEAEASYSSAVGAIGEGLVVQDLSDKILFANVAAADILGLTMSQLLEKDSYDPLWKALHEDGSPFSPEDHPSVRCSKTGKPVSNVIMNLHTGKDEQKWILINSRPVLNEDDIHKCTVTTFFDITERELAQQSLIDSQQSFSQAFNNSPIPISILNLKTGTRLAINNTFLKTYGYSREDLLDEENIDKVNLAVDQEEFKLIVKKLIRDGTIFEHPFSMYTKSGEIRDTLLNATRAYTDNKDLYIVSFFDITERKQIEDALRSSEKKFRNLAETAQIAITILGGASGNGYIYVNSYWEILTGYSRKEAENLEVLDVIDPKYRALVSERSAKRLAGQKVPEKYELKLITKSGKTKWVDFSATITEFDGKKVILSTALDITEKKLAEDELRKSTLLLEASQSIAQVGGWELDIANNNLFWTAETYRIHDTSPAEFNPTVDAALGYYLPESRQIISEALETAIKWGAGYDLELEMHTTKGRPIHVRTTCEVTLVDGKPIKLTGIIQDISKQKNEEKQLIEAKEEAEISRIYLDNILNNMGDPVFVKDDHSRLLLVNDAFCDLFDVERDHAIGKTLAEGFPPNEWEGFLRIDKEVLKTGKESIVEESLTLKEGETRTISTRKTRYIDGSGKVYLIGVIRDINERINFEKKLLESKTKFEILTDVTFEGILIHDNGVPIDMNNAFPQMFGYTRDEFIDIDLVKLIITKDHHSVVSENIKNASELPYRVMGIKKDGTEFPLEIEGKTYISEENKKLRVTAIRDITERKNAEEEIKKSKEQLVRAQKRAKLGSWTWDLVKDEISWSDEMYAIYGLPKSTVLNYDNIRETTHPDDIEHYVKETAIWLEKGKVSPLEYRIIKPNKEIIRVIGLVELQRNEEGKIIQLAGTVQDITARKEIELRLKESEASISSILNSLPYSVCVINDTGKILQVNDSWKEFGVSNGNSKEAEAPVDYNYFDVCRSDFQDEGAKSILEGLIGLLDGTFDEFDYEYPCHALDKKQWFLMRADLMKSEEKQLVISHIDISASKLSEENLKEVLSQLNLTVDSAKLGIWSHDIKTGELEWNNRSFEIFGVHPSEFDYTLDAFKKLVHPEDLEYVMEQQKEVFQNNSISGLEYRIIRPNGEIRYIDTSATPIFNGEELIKIIGVNQDITEIKKNEQELKIALNEITDLKLKVEAENIYLKEELKLEGRFDEIIGSNRSLTKLLKQVEQVAKTDATVLILGETGTGKELVARALHDASNRKNKSLVRVNCAALPAELIESELFGHEKGSFTGAINRKIGRFELAHKGTIFLDEIGELPIDMQTRLLRVLQEQEFERVGGEITIKVDVRVIAATNRNLEERVLNGEFRQDLYYRLNVFPILCPSLKDRLDDIPNLVHHFINKYNAQFNHKIKTVHQSVFDDLLGYDWPGNIRELEHIVQRAMILNQGSQLRLGKWFVAHNTEIDVSEEVSTLEVIEREYIIKILELTNWKVRGKNGASEILGLKPNTLDSRMKKLNIQR